MLLNYHIGCTVLGLPCVEVRVRFGWCGIRAEAEVVLQPAARIPPQPNRTLTPTNGNPRTIRSMWYLMYIGPCIIVIVDE